MGKTSHRMQCNPHFEYYPLNRAKLTELMCKRLFHLKCQSLNGILYFNIHKQENKSHACVFFLSTN